MPKIDGLPKTRPFMDENLNLNTEGRVALDQLESRIPITGSGSPEDVIEAPTGGIYFDTLGTTGSIIYVKLADDISGDKTKGWVIA